MCKKKYRIVLRAIESGYDNPLNWLKRVFEFEAKDDADAMRKAAGYWSHIEAQERGRLGWMAQKRGKRFIRPIFKRLELAYDPLPWKPQGAHTRMKDLSRDRKSNKIIISCT